MAEFVEAPTITSERLRLRGHTENDLDCCAALWADAQVVRFIGGRAFSRDETWARMLRYAGHWRWKQYGFWIIEEKATGDFVGEIGFADHKRDVVPSIAGKPESGWALTPTMWGRGFASEALRTVLAWGDANLGESETVCLIDPENLPSLGMAEKQGYGGLVRAKYKGKETLLLTRTRG